MNNATSPATSASTSDKDKVPANVLSHVERSLIRLKEIKHGVDQTIKNLDEGMGGNGRYEADALTNRQRDIANAMSTINQFRAYAPKNGVDAETVLLELGGVPDFTPSARALKWLPASGTTTVQANASSAGGA